ncbi:MAG: hypothetical protein RMI63_08555 [Caldimicrobium sp.]|nr:hypothetical protein [Caldimicrobium sp.]
MISTSTPIINYLRDTVNKREFYVWLISVLIFTLSLWFSLRELKLYLGLIKSKHAVEESYYRVQPEVVRLRESLKKIDWQRSFSKEIIAVKAVVDLTNLNKAIRELQTITNPREDVFFVLKEMTIKVEKDKRPILHITGDKIFYR